MRTNIILTLVTACCLIFSICSNARPAYAADCQYRLEDVEIENDVAFCKGMPVNGVVCSFHESGKLEKEIPYKNGKVEGLVKRYYESGKLQVEAFFKNGQCEGLGKVYFESGKLQLGIVYKNGLAISGICHHPNGRQVPLTSDEITNWNNGLDVNCP